MNDETYDGWKNYETWAVNLWLDNDQGSQEGCLEMAREAWEDAEAHRSAAYLTREEQARSYLADALHDELDSAMPDLGATVWADLLMASFGQVDWYEIAGVLIEKERADLVEKLLGHSHEPAPTVVIARPCEPGTYTCATGDCGKPATMVEHVPFTWPGGEPGLAFYGRCEEHRPT